MSDWWNRPYKKSRATYSDYTPPARPKPNPSSQRRYTTWNGTCTVKWSLNQPGDGWMWRQRIENSLLQFNNGTAFPQWEQKQRFGPYDDGPVYWMGLNYEPTTVVITSTAGPAILFTISFAEPKTKAQALRIVLRQLYNIHKGVHPIGILTLTPTTSLPPPTPVTDSRRARYKTFRRF